MSVPDPPAGLCHHICHSPALSGFVVPAGAPPLLSQGDGGPGAPPVRPVDLGLPEPVLRQVTTSLEEVVIFESVDRVVIVSSPGPGHFLLH